MPRWSLPRNTATNNTMGAGHARPSYMVAFPRDKGKKKFFQAI